MDTVPPDIGSGRTDQLARTAFNAAAGDYDREFESLHATKRLRRIFGKLLLQVFPSGSHILELNCGTGTDAVFLAKRGYRITATDVSEKMIAETKKKARNEGVESMVATRRLAFSELNEIDGEKFDGAFSDMGGLNCTAHIDDLAAILSSMIPERGCFVATVMSDLAIWETASFLLRGRLSDAFRRQKKGGATAPVCGNPVPVFYYSPREIADAFFPYFSVKDVLGLNVFAPPPTSRRINGFLGRSISILERLDDSIAHLRPLNRLGDHFCIVLQRTNNHTGTSSCK